MRAAASSSAIASSVRPSPSRASAEQHVRLHGFGVGLEQAAILLQSAVEALAPQAALRQDAVQFGVPGVVRAGGREITHGVGVALQAEVAHAEQHPGAIVGRTLPTNLLEHGNGFTEVSLFEFRDGQVVADLRLVRIETQRLAVLGRGCGQPALLGERDAQTAAHHGIARRGVARPRARRAPPRCTDRPASARSLDGRHRSGHARRTR